MVAPLMALSLPLLDVGLSIGRRFLRNQPIFQPDRGHIHHRLLGRGLHPRTVAFILYAVCGVAAILSLLQSSLSFHLGGLIIVLFCSLSILGIRRLDYVEFRTAGQILRQGRILQMMQGEIHLQSFRAAMGEAKTLEDCWSIVREACEEMDFCSVRMTIHGRSFQETFRLPIDDPSWQIRVRLNNEGQIILTRSDESISPALTGFLKALQETTTDTKRFASDINIADVSASISLLGAAGSRIAK